QPTKLYALKVDVSAENNIELEKLPGKPEVYSMDTYGPAKLVQALKEGYCLAPEILTLKKDAIVMFVKNNFDRGYINGTLGKIIGFDEDSGFPVVKTVQGKEIIAYRESWAIEDRDEIIASISQVPLRLAWAITVHKSQGMTLDCAEIDLSKSFEFGMGYVALSRVRSLDSMRLIGLNKFALEVNKNMVEFDKKLREKSGQDLQEIIQISGREVKNRQKEFLENSKGNNADGNIFGKV
ncbi:AAA family ATPase, partial [Candidatus Falkowbacteria bacterium]|nr:AAA family ATPase [Candidatus Falkowbacteria bacterium]